MHYYSFADGPARSSIVNFIWRLNVPNSNAVPRYFSLTRTLFTAISPIKSVVDVNVKSATLSRTRSAKYRSEHLSAVEEKERETRCRCDSANKAC